MTRVNRLRAKLARSSWSPLVALVVAAGALLLTAYSSGHAVADRAQPARPWSFDFEGRQTALPPAGTDPDGWLRQIDAAVAQRDFDSALQLSAELTRRVPHFQPGQWLHAELLLATAGAGMPASPAADADAQRVRADILAELRLRLQSVRQPHVPGTVPAGLGQLDPRTPYLAVVDATTARLYLFRNESTPEALKLSLVMDTYASLGLNGVNKKVQGDKRSPIGVYFTQRLLPDARLPDLYGAGALTLDYPSAWDHAQGRTGSGIWIHGTPTAQYSRAPEASDGCVVVSNDAMERLMALGATRGIPVWIQEQVRWVPAEAAQAAGRELAQALGLNTIPAATPTHTAHTAHTASRHHTDPPALHRHLFTWTDEGRVIAMTDTPNGTGTPARAFWVQSPQGWTRLGTSTVATLY